MYDLLEPAAVTYLYVLSVLAPYIGLVIGIVLIKKALLEENRRPGKNCTLISSIMLGLMLVCLIAYALMYAFLGLRDGPRAGRRLTANTNKIAYITFQQNRRRNK